jgi:hypothetical protein
MRQDLAVAETCADHYSIQESSAMNQAMEKPPHEASLEYRESTVLALISALASGIPVVHGKSRTEVHDASGSLSTTIDGPS